MSPAEDELLLDAEQFGGYAELLPPAQMAALVAAFDRELATRPGELLDLLDRDDVGSAREAAHRLKGAALTLGANRIAALAAAIEHAHPDALRPLAATLPACALATAGALRSLS